jgi:benzoate/toluate 1,2-dioxygenase alpha subunit
MATPDDLEEFRACQEGYMGRCATNGTTCHAVRITGSKGPDAEADKIGLKPILSGVKTEDEGLYVAQHSYWLDEIRKAVAAK